MHALYPLAQQSPGTMVLATQQPDRLLRWLLRLKMQCDDLVSMPTSSGLRVSVESRDKTTWIYAQFVGEVVYHVTSPYSIMCANLYRLCDKLNVLKQSDCLVLYLPADAEELKIRVLHANNLSCNETHHEKLMWVKHDAVAPPDAFLRPAKVRMTAAWFRGVCERACRSTKRILFEWNHTERVFHIASGDRAVDIEQYIPDTDAVDSDTGETNITVQAEHSFVHLVNADKVKEFVKTDGKIVELKFESDPTAPHPHVSFHYQHDQNFIHYIQATSVD